MLQLGSNLENVCQQLEHIHADITSGVLGCADAVFPSSWQWEGPDTAVTVHVKEGAAEACACCVMGADPNRGVVRQDGVELPHDFVVSHSGKGESEA
eukprot:12563987-Ditylum_brightwellii.AAC.1